MNTDRELLELAAKAAGVEGKWSPTNEAIHVNTAPLRNYVLWSPLHDDGDALRLAVKLGIADLLIVWVDGNVGVGTDTDCIAKESLNGDPYAATRRAIVRAAAEIGRTTE